jgi:hypothetical protein
MALVFASAAFAPGGPAGLMLDMLDWPLGDGVAADTEAARWLAAIGGGVWASLSALYYLVVAPAVARGDNEARRGGLISIIVWFVVDSAGSVAAGVPSNALFNVPFLILFLVPLLGVKTGAAQPALHRA